MKSKTLLIFCIFLLLLSGCGKRSDPKLWQTLPPSTAVFSCSEEASPPPVLGEHSDWTIFLYLCGADLESKGGAATANLQELLSARLSDRVRVVIQTGGAKRWMNDTIDAKSLGRYVVAQNGMSLVEQLPLASMGEAETLGSFLSWGAENFPADHYMALIWNHGGGSVAGVAFDELFKNDSLTLDEVSQGLEHSGVWFDLVGFDSCLMASLESAAAVAPYAGYMVASEEYEPGLGWDYRALYNYMSTYPSSSPESIGSAICSSYLNKCRENQQDGMATLSVVDLKRIPDLIRSFNRMAEEMVLATSDLFTLRLLTQAAQHSENFGGNTRTEGYTNMIDLGDLARSAYPALPRTASAVSGALEKAVCFQVSGPGRKNSSGLSVFYPLKLDPDALQEYSNYSVSANYLQFFSCLSEEYEVPEEFRGNLIKTDSIRPEDYTLEWEEEFTEKGHYQLRITSGQDVVESIQSSLYLTDYEKKEYICLGVDNNINYSWESGLYWDNFSGYWPSINGQRCMTVLIESGENYNLYSVPVLLNGKNTNLRASYHWRSDGSGYFQVLGLYGGVDPGTGMSSRDTQGLKEGDQLEFVFDVYSWNTGKHTTRAIGKTIVSGPLIMEPTVLKDGDYFYQYEITDLFSRVSYSDGIILNYASEKKLSPKIE